MPHSLRVRVFVTVAIVVGVATIAAGVLSRRETLFEDRLITSSSPAPPLEGVISRLESGYAARGWREVRDLMDHLQPALNRRGLVLDLANHVVAAPTPEPTNVRVTSSDANGDLVLQIEMAGVQKMVVLRGAPSRSLTGPDGAVIGRVVILPDEVSNMPEVPPWHSWLTATALTAGIALLVTFLASGRVLRPVGELTAAARALQEGRLDVRVKPSGRDEISDLGRAFNDMAARLADTERQKHQLISDVAHELRSPVTNLRCALEAMQDNLMTSTPARIDSLHAETLLLQRLITDLLDLALADAGGLTLHCESVEVGQLAARVIATAEGAPPIRLTVDEEVPAVRADRDRLEQMLRNLLDNARRYTPPEGCIAVRVRTEGPWVSMIVEDNGRGIPAEHVPHVFDRFYRVDASRDRALGGAGLGLAIVRRLAVAHGGTTLVTSAGEGQGSTFTIRLPRSADAAMGHPSS
jgi:signal transduction histidine kinase